MKVVQVISNEMPILGVRNTGETSLPTKAWMHTALLETDAGFYQVVEFGNNKPTVVQTPIAAKFYAAYGKRVSVKKAVANDWHERLRYKQRKKFRKSPDEPEYNEYGERLRLKHPPELLERLSEAQNHRCAICGLRLNEIPLNSSDRRFANWAATLEHYIRFRDGGADDESNIAVTHAKCNQERN